MSEFFNRLNNETEVGNGSGTTSDAEFRELKQVWEVSRYETTETPDAAAQWAAVQRKIRLAEDQAIQPLGGFSRFFLNMRPMLAMASMLILVLGAWYGFRQWKPAPYATERGIQQEVNLRDRSIISINADSSLKLADGFNWTNREVSLTGEAFFDVEKGKHPFIIHAEGTRIQVIGTRFNVYARDGKVHVTVHEGIVNVASAQDSIRLTQGQTYTVQEGQMPKAPRMLDLSELPPWLEGFMFCENMPLEDICREAERRFDVKIQIKNTIVSTSEVSGLIEAKDAETLLRSVCNLLDAHFEFIDGTYYIE